MSLYGSLGGLKGTDDESKVHNVLQVSGAIAGCDMCMLTPP